MKKPTAYGLMKIKEIRQQFGYSRGENEMKTEIKITLSDPSQAAVLLDSMLKIGAKVELVQCVNAIDYVVSYTPEAINGQAKAIKRATEPADVAPNLFTQLPKRSEMPDMLVTK